MSQSLEMQRAINHPWGHMKREVTEVNTQSIFQTLFRRVWIWANKLQEFLPIGKVMSKLEIDAGVCAVPFPLAKPSRLHLVSMCNSPKPYDLSNFPCLDSKKSLLLTLPCTFAYREKMLLSCRPWYSCPWDISSYCTWITWHSIWCNFPCI